MKDKTLDSFVRECELVRIDPKFMGGRPTLKGTTLPIATIFQDLSDGYGTWWTSQRTGVPEANISALLDELSVWFNEPFIEKTLSPSPPDSSASSL